MYQIAGGPLNPLGFGFVPYRVHLLEGHAGESAAVLPDLLLEVVETAAELGAGAVQRGLGVDALEPGGVDYRE